MKHARPDYDRFQDPEGKIPEDEPVFILRAQDKHAAMAVAFYAGALEYDPDVDEEMVKVCKQWAMKMKAWPIQKSPDM